MINSWTKGQIKLEWKYEVENFPNYQRKNLMDFCPASLHRLGTYSVIFFQGNSTQSGVCITYLPSLNNLPVSPEYSEYTQLITNDSTSNFYFRPVFFKFILLFQHKWFFCELSFFVKTFFIEYKKWLS